MTGTLREWVHPTAREKRSFVGLNSLTEVFGTLWLVPDFLIAPYVGQNENQFL